jgi:hypothetical protein
MGVTHMIRVTAFVCAILAVFPGCSTVNADLPGVLRSDVTKADVETVGRLDVQRGHTFYLWGLLNQPPADFIAPALVREVKAQRGDGVQGFEYQSESTLTDCILSIFTLGILTPRTFRFTGDIVRIRKPASADGPVTGAEAEQSLAPPPSLSY